MGSCMEMAALGSGWVTGRLDLANCARLERQSAGKDGDDTLSSKC